MSYHRYDWREICIRIADLYNNKNMSVAEAHKTLQEEGMDLPPFRTVQNRIRIKCHKYGIDLEMRHPRSEPTPKETSREYLRKLFRQIRHLTELAHTLQSECWTEEKESLQEVIAELYDRIDDALK